MRFVRFVFGSSCLKPPIRERFRLSQPSDRSNKSTAPGRRIKDFFRLRSTLEPGRQRQGPNQCAWQLSRLGYPVRLPATWKSPGSRGGSPSARIATGGQAVAGFCFFVRRFPQCGVSVSRGGCALRSAGANPRAGSWIGPVLACAIRRPARRTRVRATSSLLPVRAALSCDARTRPGLSWLLAVILVNSKP